MSAWEMVKNRTATDGGAVWRSVDGRLFRRTGGAEVAAEAQLQRRLAELGYPVPEPVEAGTDEQGRCFFTERSVGDASLHDQALADAGQAGQVADHTLRTALEVSTRLLTAQARHARPATPAALRDWFAQASFADNVYAENPDLETPRVHALVDRALGRLADLPMALSHLDYGMPNAFPAGVIDWQHHGDAPLGYDVYPMLEVAAFKGGNRGYAFTPAQRTAYLDGLDKAAAAVTGGRTLSAYLGEYLLVKCFFFLALMRPPADGSRPDKHTKWTYRRELFRRGLEQYETTGRIDTGSFPTLAAHTAATA